MPRDRCEETVRRLLAAAGVAVNGPQPWDITVHDDCFYRRVAGHGSLGLGESYMEGWWDCPRTDEFIARILHARLDRQIAGLADLVEAARARFCNLQDRCRAFEVGRRHYDIGNDLYRRMLDRRMIYSCALWKNAADLDQAQEHKLDLVCRKLLLEPGMRLLDIGCGWGGTARYAAERYGVSVVGVTVSTEQAEVARETCRGLPVEIRLQDYREISDRFDRVLSIGMFEHVGYKNYRTFMEKVRACLADDGIFLLHTIGGNRTRTHTDTWIHRYIFPNSMLPSPRQVAAAIDDLFVLEDWHNFGADYDRTLMAWHHNFERARPELAARYDARFCRMWTYYLLACAGTFRARSNQLWQLVLTPGGIPGGYSAPHHA